MLNRVYKKNCYRINLDYHQIWSQFHRNFVAGYKTYTELSIKFKNTKITVKELNIFKFPATLKTIWWEYLRNMFIWRSTSLNITI